ncbi:hypothetical protein D9M72_408830 [compost metagenome]
MQALARLLRQAQAAAHAAHHLLHGVQAHAAAGHLGNRVAHAEARQQQEVEQLSLRQPRRGLFGRQPPPHDGAAQGTQVDACAVVENLDDQAARIVARLQRDAALRRLALRRAHLGRFDAVVHRVAQQVRQRRVQCFQDVAVHLRAGADQLQVHRLAERAPEVAHHARVAGQRVRQRAHARGQRAVIEPARQSRGAVIVLFELVQPRGQLVVAFVQQLAQFGQRGVRSRARVAVRCVPQGFLQCIDGAQCACLLPPCFLQRGAEGAQPVRLDHGLAGERQQLVKRIGIHAQHPLLGVVCRCGCRGFCNRRCRYRGRWFR